MFSDSILIVAVKECHEEVHDKEDAKEEVDHEEYGEGAAVLVSGEHDVGAVRSRQEHQHVKAGAHIVREIAYALNRAAEDTETQERKKENIETDEKDH